MSDTPRITVNRRRTDSTPSASRVIRRGAGQACVYCRRRKMKCTGERPTCRNCETYNQECIYRVAPRRERPTLAELDRLRRENRQFRQQRERRQSVDSDVDVESDTVHAQPRSSSRQLSHAPSPSTLALTTLLRTAPRPLPHSAINASPNVSPNPTYHGPTSTLYNAQVQDQRSGTTFTPEQEAWMRKGLFAAAAEQRHLEMINARQGKLDFDGVDSDLALHLLNLHWNRQHHAFLVTYRPSFMRDMACGGPYFSKLLLNAIYYGAAKFSPRLELRKDPDDVRTAGWRFRDRVRQLLGEALDHSSITTIQALLQMSNSLFALGDEQSASWIYAGMSFRMIADLGLHIDVEKLPDPQRFTDEEIEVRRRVYWAAFVVDKMQSLYQGRSASLQADDCQVPIKFLDEYEELEHWQPVAYHNEIVFLGSPSYSVSTFSELCKLCIILADVLKAIYRPPHKKNMSEISILDEMQQLEDRIQNWTNILPAHIKPDLTSSGTNAPPPHVLSLLVMRSVIRILLHRPFVAEGHLHSTDPSITHSSLAACAEAATQIVQIVRLYDRAFSIRRAPYLISYATYVAATIHVRIAAKQRNSSEAHESLLTCLNVLDKNTGTNSAAEKAAKVIRGLSQTMNVSVDTAGGFELEAETSRRQRVAITSSTKLNDTAKQPGLALGSFASDVDVDAIIQSFWNTNDRSTTRKNNGGIVDPSTTESAYNTSNTGDASWAQLDEGLFPMEDMLFGFNTSDLDFLYLQPNSS